MASGDTQHMKRYEPARSELIDSNQPRAQLQAQVREVSAIPADRLKRSSPNTHPPWWRRALPLGIGAAERAIELRPRLSLSVCLSPFVYARARRSYSGSRVDLLSRLFLNLSVGRHALRLHDGHDRIGGVGEEFTVALEFVEASWGRDRISVRAH
jgi:hypothetical protein